VLDEAASKNNTVIRYASECGNPEYDVTGSYFDVDGDRYHINLPGIYQPDNAATAIMAAKVLFEGTDGAAIPQYIIARALEGARWPARFEVISRNPYIVLDGAHNMDGIIRLKESIEVLFDRNEYYVIGIMGVFKDKDVSGMTTVIHDSFDELHTVTAPSSRGMDSSELADIVKDTGFTGIVMSHNDITARELAYRLAMNETTKAAGDDRGVVIVIFGSLSLAAG
jgi:dihydrofolate synthase/folylpolyglutamate synthase